VRVHGVGGKKQKIVSLTTGLWGLLLKLCTIMVYGLAILLVAVCLSCAAVAEFSPVFISASFDDLRSFIVSNDSVSLQGTLFFNQNVTTSQLISVILYPYGDVASAGGLRDGSNMFTFSPSSYCTDLPCQVSFDSVPYGDWCSALGKGVSVAVDGVDSGIKAVFGLGALSGPSKCSFANSYNVQPAFAIVKLSPIQGSSISGAVVIQLVDDALSVSGVITGLQVSTSHGIHVHTNGDIRDSLSANNTGSHFSFLGQVHGLVNNASRHTGDLGNIISDSNGVAAFNILVPLVGVAPDRALTLLAQASSAIGRAIIVHALADDGFTQPSGGSGSRIGQGVIGYADTVSSDAVLNLLKVGGSFGCGCTLTDENSGVTYNGFCQAKDCSQQTWTALILVVTLGPLSVLLVLLLMKYQTYRNRNRNVLPSKKVGVSTWSGQKGHGETSLPLLSS
jgi:Cu-Zn family superoxide dismutase